MSPNGTNSLFSHNTEIHQILNYDAQIGSVHRNKTGAYYTPLDIALEMTKNAYRAFFVLQYNHVVDQGQLLQDIDLFLSMKDPQASGTLGQNMRGWFQVLCQAPWLDMACGTGVFALAHLVQIDRLLGFWQGTHGLDRGDLLKRAAANMVLCDLNAGALDQVPQLLALVFNTQISLLPRRIHCDALSDLGQTSLVQGILNEGGFDFIVGNPPYLGERGNKDIFAYYKSLPHLRPYYEGKMDLFYFFIHLGIDWLSPRGIISQITTRYFATADSASKLRQVMNHKLHFFNITERAQSSAFKDVTNLCFLSFAAALKQPNLEGYKAQVVKDDTTFEVANSALFDARGQLVVDSPQDTLVQVLKRYEALCHLKLEDVLAVNQGVVSGADRSRSQDKLQSNQLQKSGPIFVFEPLELEAHLQGQARPKYFKPFVKNSHIKPFNVDASQFKWLLYTDDPLFLPHQDQLNLLTCLQAAEDSQDYWLAHLDQHRPLLSKRREVVTGAKHWYQLQWGRAQEVFERPKLVVPQRARANYFAYVAQPLYGSADVYFLGDNQMTEIQLKAYGAFLNSPLVHAWLYYKGKRKGNLLELYATPLKQIPIPEFSILHVEQLAALYDLCAQDLASRDQLHEWICTFMNLDKTLRQALWQWDQARYL